LIYPSEHAPTNPNVPIFHNIALSSLKPRNYIIPKVQRQKFYRGFK
jgi:hypothetical protein